MTPIPEWQETLWRFAYDNIDPADFEKWAYAAEDLPTWLNSDLYLRLLETNYQDHLQVHELKATLQAWLNSSYPRTCDCLVWKDFQVVPLGYETPMDLFLAKFELLKEQTPWIYLARCKSCTQSWYLAVDTQEDNYYLQRLTSNDVKRIERGFWPSTFDGLDAVWPSREKSRLSGFNNLLEWQGKNNAQHSVPGTGRSVPSGKMMARHHEGAHSTSGCLRVFRWFTWLKAGFAKRLLSHPPRHTVGTAKRFLPTATSRPVLTRPLVIPRPENEFDTASYKEFLEPLRQNREAYTRLYDLHLQYEEKERWEAPERKQMDLLDQELRLLRLEYFRRLPIRPIAQCPYCGTYILQPVDIFSLMGFYRRLNIEDLYKGIPWCADRLSLKWQHCEHFIITTFSVNLHNLTPNDLPSWVLCRRKITLTMDSAPQVMVWPLIARQTSAVIHALPIGRLDDPEPMHRYTIYFVSYFGGPTTNLYTEAMWVPTDLGGPATGGVYYDLDLIKWVKAGRLFWLDPDNPEHLMRGPAKAFPYANIQPKGWYEIVEGGRIDGPKPYNTTWQGPALRHDKSYKKTIE